MEKKGKKIFAVDRRARLIASVVIAIGVFLITKNTATPVVRYLVTWIAFASSNLILSWFVILSFHPRDVKAMADKEDSSGTFIFITVILAAFFSLFAIIFLLLSVPQDSKHGFNIHVLLAFAAVFSSWTLAHTLFTMRYAHLFYSFPSTRNAPATALDFPNETQPDYLDFAYFSFVVGMTFQVSDVTINSRKIRRLALLHSFLSFIYNTVIVALSINILSGIISYN